VDRQIQADQYQAPARERLSRVRAALRCPACMGELETRPDEMACLGCAERYPFAGERPVLIARADRGAVEAHLASEDGRRMANEYAAPPSQATAEPAWVRVLRPPQVMHRYFPEPRDGPAKVLFAAGAGGPPLVLNVGGGPQRETPGEITLNIGPFPNVDLIADGQRIPVADGTFDAVFSLAVLEHVPDPQRVVAEMIRVLRPGGYLYSEVPFIFFFHGYPTDYTRFTLEGMKRLFRGLDEARFGLTHGPVSAVLQSGNMALQMLVPPRPRLLRKAANGIYRWLFFPFKYLDLMLREHPDAHTVAGGFWVLGRKPGGAASR
jgi:hypothetical protein